MNKQRTARLNAIMCNVDRIEDNPSDLNDEDQQRKTKNVVENCVAKTHEYILREPKKPTYCEVNENEVTEDFSPDVSEYLPSPERMKTLQQSNTPSSIGGNSDYIEKASEHIIKTPSTISNISLVFENIDFIASPSVVYEANSLLNTPRAQKEHGVNTPNLTPTSSYGQIKQKTKRSSKRCLNVIYENDNEPSTSGTIINLKETQREKPAACLEITGLDDLVLQQENDSDSILTNNDFYVDVDIASLSHDDITETENNNNVVAERHSPILDTGHGGEDQNEFSSLSTTLLSSQTTNTRKRKQNLKARQDVKNKKLKNSGEAYQGCRSKKVYEKKYLKACCSCTKKCSEKITQEQRENLMKEFYKIGDHEKQWQYIVNNTLVEDIKRLTIIRNRNRTQSIKYFFEIESNKVQVCNSRLYHKGAK